MRSIAFLTLLIVALCATSFAAENLHLNPKLDYSSDSQDGPLITGDDMDTTLVAGKPTYVIMYGEACYLSLIHI